MLSEAPLRALLAGGESDRVEFTTSDNRTDKFAEAVCAFANDFPGSGENGHLVIGANNDGRPSGLRVTERLLRKLGELRSDVNLEPLPAMAVRKQVLPEGEVAVISVAPSDLPPVRYKGRVWIRVGPSRRAATRQEEGILTERRTASHHTFDLRPCPGCTSGDLVLDLFLAGYLPAAVSREVIEENDRNPIEQMASLRFYDLAADRPTNAAVLLFAKDPLRWIPGAEVLFVRWAGTSVADDPIATRSFRGDLINVLREIRGFASMPIRSRPVEEDLLRERTEMDYPAVAVRELLLNAVMHRSYESNAPVRFYWYDDRIEIQSPGGLYGSASPENFPSRTDYRNPVLAEAMATLGYVNRFGRGVIRAQEGLRRNGNPPARFQFEPASVLAVIPAKR